MKLKMSLIPILTLLLSFNTFAATWYVAVDGDDDTGDGSQANPWQTIAYGISQISGGDTLIIQEGNYDDPIVLDNTHSGLDESQCTLIKAEGVVSIPYMVISGVSSDLPVQFVHINGVNVQSCYGSSNHKSAIHMNYAGYCHLENITCTGVSNLRYGLQLGNVYNSVFAMNTIGRFHRTRYSIYSVYMENADNNYFIGNDFSGNVSDMYSACSFGIYAEQADGNSFINNTIKNNIQTGLGNGGIGYGIGIALHTSTDNEIRGNDFSGNKTAAIFCYYDVESTVITDNKLGDHIVLKDAINVTIQRNVFYDSTRIILGWLKSVYAGGIYGYGNESISGLIIRNNIFSGRYYKYYYYPNNYIPVIAGPSAIWAMRHIPILGSNAIYNNVFDIYHDEPAYYQDGSIIDLVACELTGTVLIDHNAYDGLNFAGLSSSATGDQNIQAASFGLRNNYTLTEDSPCIGTGLNGSDIGLGAVDDWLDYDEDDMPDIWEMKYLSVLNLAFDDGDDNADTDALLNKEEFLCATSPNNPDSDGNGIADDEDDSDLDGMSNSDELAIGTNPLELTTWFNQAELVTTYMDDVVLKAFRDDEAVLGERDGRTFFLVKQGSTYADMMGSASADQFESYDVNEAGFIVGQDINGNIMIYNSEAPLESETISTAADDIALAINNHGTLVGASGDKICWSYDPEPGMDRELCGRTHADFFGAPYINYSEIVDVNDAGMMLGYTVQDEWTQILPLSYPPYIQTIHHEGKVYAWQRKLTPIDVDGTIEYLPVYHNLGHLGGWKSWSTAINEAGVIIGSSLTTSGDEHAFVWANGSMVDIGTLGGDDSQAVGINNYGQILCWSEDASSAMKACLYEKQKQWLIEDCLIGTALTALNGKTIKDIGINNKGQVVVAVENALQRWQIYVLSPIDSDGDGVGNVIEVLYEGTDPYVSEGGGGETGFSAQQSGMGPEELSFSAVVAPASFDADGDGMPDWWEIENGLDPLSDNAGEDADGDGVSNVQEYELGLNPLNADTDDDGLTDGYEVYALGTDPLALNSRADLFNRRNILDGGASYSVAIDGNGNIWSWGRYTFGELGDGRIGDQYFTGGFLDDQIYSDVNPVKAIIPGDPEIIEVSASHNHTIAVSADGNVYEWGANHYGELGLGTSGGSYYADARTPLQVTGLSDITSVAAGFFHNYALTEDGHVWAWGSGWQGQLGVGWKGGGYTPMELSLTDVIEIAAGARHGVALKSDGTVWTWGWNNYGQIGNGETNNVYYPVQVGGLSDIIAISAGTFHSMALKGDGTVYTWGGNQYGELGVGDESIAFSLTPVQVPEEDLHNVVQIDAYNLGCMALTGDGELYVWGCGGNGQLGDNSWNNSMMPVSVAGVESLGLTPDVGMLLSAASIHNMIITSNGDVYSWGCNHHAQLGFESWENTHRQPVTLIFNMEDLGAMP